DGGVRIVVPARLNALDAAVSRLEVTLRRVELTHDPAAAAPAAVRPLTTAATRLSAAATSGIDRLLRARIDRDTRRARLVEILAAVAALMAIYLFSGFYFCVGGAVHRMIATLGAVAAGRLDQRVVLSNHDELGYVATAINDMVGKVRY